MARSEETRARVLDIVLGLLVEGGRDAVSTRTVTAAAGIQAPTLYRIFGSMQGLLDAVAAHGFATHLSTWEGWQPGDDPVEAMRAGWDVHVAWGVENPALYSIAYGDARPGVSSPAADAIDAILRTLVEQVAAAGRLVVPVQDAVHLLRAVGAGIVFTLIAMPADARDPQLSHRGREAVLSTVLGAPDDRPAAGRSGTAMQLRMDLDDATELTAHERALLGDWLDRIAAGDRGAT